MRKATKAQLDKAHIEQLNANKALSRQLNEAHNKLEKLEEQRDEYQHLAESVINGVRDTLNSDHKLYQNHHNTYFALWYWVEWGNKVNREMKTEQSKGEL